MHIYREISTSQVKRNDSLARKNSPQIPTRTSSLALDKMEKKTSPVDIFERYLKSAYTPNKSDYYTSRENINSSAGSDLRRSFRRSNSRPLSPIITTNENGMFFQNTPDSNNSSPVHKIRARSNSFKENHNGWINVGPEFSIKPAVTNGVQPLINVTIVQPAPQIPEPDYHSSSGSLTGSAHLTADQSAVRLNSRLNLPHGLRPSSSFRQSGNNNHSQVGYASEGSQLATDQESPLRNQRPVTSFPPSSQAQPQEKSPSATTAASRFGSLISRRSSSISRSPPNPQTLLSHKTASSTDLNLKPAIKKKRAYSQSGLDRKKNVTFSEYAVVFS